MASISDPHLRQNRWHHELKGLFVQSLERCRAGETDLEEFFTVEQQVFLGSIGQTPREIYDFADDHIHHGGDPDWETVLLISAARRDYFLTVQHGQPSGHTVSMDDLPAKDAKLDGMPWLARTIQKAGAKLRGEMPAELMFGCSGDLSFFREHHLHPADFLRHVWAANGDERKIVEYVKSNAASVEPTVTDDAAPSSASAQA